LGVHRGQRAASLFHTGTPEQVADYVKDLIDTIGQDGGFFMSPGAVQDHSKPENLHAFYDTTREYGAR
jgi:alkanesulfonate monooxygenase SsuD/methylene tetrahydromethanopterin reductase-like flavin-dependent oxidoreductase (luciferase family)